MTPVNNTIIVAVVVAILAGFIPLDYLLDMVSIGTLVAFIVVSLGVIILRVREPDLPRGIQGAAVSRHARSCRCSRASGFCTACTGTPGSGSAPGSRVALLFYLFWSRHHSALNAGGATATSRPRFPATTTSCSSKSRRITTSSPATRMSRDRRRRLPGRKERALVAAPGRRGGQGAQDVTRRGHCRAQAVDDPVTGPDRRRICLVGRPIGRRLAARGAALPGPDRRGARRQLPQGRQPDRWGRPSRGRRRTRRTKSWWLARRPTARSARLSSDRPPTGCCTPRRCPSRSVLGDTGARVLASWRASPVPTRVRPNPSGWSNAWRRSPRSSTSRCGWSRSPSEAAPCSRPKWACTRRIRCSKRGRHSCARCWRS